jgi:AraC-like DNA-binding protein
MPPPRSIAVELAESATGWSELVRTEPAPSLAGMVTGFCGYQERSAAVVRRVQAATSRIPVIISFGDPLTVDQPGAGGGAGRFASFTAGLHGGFAVTEYVGGQHGVQVDLSPLGALRIFGVPGSAIAGSVVGLEDLAPELGRSLPDRLASASGWPERFEIVEGALTRLAERGPVSDPTVEWAWAELARTHGAVRVADLVAASGWSHRHLTARFRSQVGITPKAAAGILRFEHASSVLATAGMGLAEIADRCGYADQSHLNRACRRYAGTTPAALCALAARHAEPGQVEFVQEDHGSRT